MGGNAFSKNVGDAAAGVFTRRKSRKYYKLEDESGDSAFKTDNYKRNNIAGETGKSSFGKIHEEIIKHEQRLTRRFSPGPQASAPKESVNKPAKICEDTKPADQQSDDTYGKGAARKEGNILSRIFSRRRLAPREPSFHVISSTLVDPSGTLARHYRDAEQKAAKDKEFQQSGETTEYHEYAWEPPLHGRQYAGADEVNTQEQHEHYEQDTIGPANPFNDDNDVSTQIDRELAVDSNYQHLRLKKAKCNSCLEELTWDRCPLLACGHHYCVDCINGLFTRSMVDDQLFPPRCCRQLMTLDQVGRFLSNDLIQGYHLRNLEMNTTDRTYCYNKDCVTFIDPATIVDKAATCQKCNFVTCIECKKPSHEGACEPDLALRQLLQTANKNGWKRCPQCGMMIELSRGCNHITCNCGYHFCYICCTRWRTCHCPQFQERNIIYRANDILADLAHIQDRLRLTDNTHGIYADLWNELPFRQQDDDGNTRDHGPEAIYPVVHFILNRHECNHDAWLNWAGGAQCMICEHRVTTQVYRCRRCLYRVCENCRNHRL